MDKLSGLRDIHLPDWPSVFPLAIGYYMVFFSLFFLSVAVIQWAYKKHKKKQFKQFVLNQLRLIVNDKKMGSPILVGKAWLLMKQVMLTTRSTTHVDYQQYQGDAWFLTVKTAFLMDESRLKWYIETAPFLKEGDFFDEDIFFEGVERWLKGQLNHAKY